MKTRITTIAALLLMSASLTFQSCKDEESKNTAEVPSGKAIITGKLTADLILNNGTKEGVAGVTVTGSINTADLITNPGSGAYARKTYTATTNSQGVYTLEVDAHVKAVNVSFGTPEKFIAEQTLENGTKQRTVFTRATAVPANITLNNGQTYVQDVEYDFSTETSMGVAKVTGQVFFRNDLCRVNPDSQLTAAPAGTIIVATWNDDEGRDREVELTVGANGKVELAVETKSSITITLKGRKFTADIKELDGGDCITKSNHEYTVSSRSVSAVKNETNEFSNIIFE